MIPVSEWNDSTQFRWNKRREPVGLCALPRAGVPFQNTELAGESDGGGFNCAVY